MLTWTDKALKAGWSQQEVDLFLLTHPAAKNIEFKDGMIWYDHTSVMSISGTSYDDKVHVHQVETTLRGSWSPPRPPVAEVCWPNKPFDGTWCPCHGSAGCTGTPKFVERTQFCDCKYIDKGHRKTCTLYAPPRPPDEEIPGSREAVAKSAPAPAPAAPTPATAAKTKRAKKEKKVIESLALPGMGAKKID